MGGIRRRFGALLGAKKSIRAGENLFALDSALLFVSPVPFVRCADARNLVTSNIRRRFGVRISPAGLAVSQSTLSHCDCIALLWRQRDFQAFQSFWQAQPAMSREALTTEIVGLSRLCIDEIRALENHVRNRAVTTYRPILSDSHGRSMPLVPELD